MESLMTEAYLHALRCGRWKLRDCPGLAFPRFAWPLAARSGCAPYDHY